MGQEFQMDMDDFLPLRDVVFKTLRKGILTGELKPGERLMEIHLANKLGVSRTPIREAIRKLELEGLVTMIPRRGAEVAQITEKSMKDVLEVRRSLDSLAVELACKRITDDEIEELRLACLEFEDAIKTKSVTQIAKADVSLHDIIFRATRNMRLKQIMNNLAEQMYRYRFEYIKDETQHRILVDEHQKIYESILNRKIDDAKKAIENHIDNQEISIIKQIRIEESKNRKK
ncbi:MAG: GntR family transcriptional regulator [Lachnospiraceae bacterium]